MKKLIATLALAGASALAWALPTLQQVEAEVGQGRYAQAESMMQEVVAAKPGSARPHYVYAEILAHEGKFARAADEARTARQIDPDVKFTDAAKFAAFEAELQRAQAPTVRTPLAPTPLDRSAAQVAPTQVAPAAASGLPSWVWFAAIAAAAFALWRFFSRRSAATGAGMAGSGYGTPATMGPGAPGSAPGGVPYGPGYAPQRPGSGMLGVGLGAAGGLAAGMLAERMLHSHRDGNVDPGAGGGGFFDSPQGGSAASDLENRPIDFGTGGNDWDSGSVDVGGSDVGGSDGGWD